MPAPHGRDLEQTGKRLLEWFSAKLPEAEGIDLADLSGPGTTGFSNDTLMFDLSYRQGGRERSEPLVARIQPTGYQVFPEYDLARQFRVQQSLGETEVPVALLKGWLAMWTKHYDLPMELEPALRPHRAATGNALSVGC